MSDEVITVTETKSEVKSEVKDAVAISETVIWNLTDKNISVGAAVLHGEQLHLSVFETHKAERNFKPEQLRTIMKIKPNEATLFKLAEPKKEEIDGSERHTEKTV